MQFLFQPLTWAFFLVMVPVLIHLINMMRHRRVKWAAMEFLLKSHKKNRKWIFLKQFLLMLMRMAAFAAIVAMLAGLVTNDQWAGIFGGKVTHHYVLVDDSFSMSEVVSGESAFDRARKTTLSIAERARAASSPQRFTLVRFSQAGASGSVAGGVIDLNAESVDGAFAELLEERRRMMDVSQLAVGPEEALALVRQLLDDDLQEDRVVYLLSDFRRENWENPAEARQGFEELEKAGADIHLVNCAAQPQPNLAIVKLEPGPETRAAGVPLFVNLAVTNFGARTAKDIPVKLRTTYYDPIKEEPLAAGKLKGERQDLPPVLIEQIEPGETVSRRVQVYFPTSGKHVVEAWLPYDSIETDNRRWCVIDFPDGVPVLVVDGGIQNNDAYFLETMFRPSERTSTGIRPQVEEPAYLRDVTLETLLQYRTVYLLNVPRIDPTAVATLEQYVRMGGGLAIFMGPESIISFYNDLYAGGQGLMPAPLDRSDLLPPAIDENEPDFWVEDHPVFRVLAGEGNPFTRGILFEQYLRVPEDWVPEEGSTARVLARLRNRDPLVLEQSYGDGRVVVFLTTLSPVWNTWARDPSMVVVLLELQAYLSAPARRTIERLVGSPLAVTLDAEDYAKEVKFFLPGETGTPSRLVARNAEPPDKERDDVLAVQLGGLDADDAAPQRTDRRGVYEVWATEKKGDATVLRYALNVDSSEGDTATIEPTALTRALAGVHFDWHRFDEVSYDFADASGFDWTELLLLVLVGLMIAEQAVAYSASYHPPTGSGATGGAS